MPTAFAGQVKRLDAIECGFSCLAPRLARGGIKVSNFRRQKRTAGKLAEISHLLLDGLAQILQEMKAVGDLLCLRSPVPRSLSIKPAPVPADDLDFWMLPEPFCGFLHRSFWLHLDNFPALQIDDDRSIAIASAPAPVINANNSYGLSVTEFLT